MATTNLNMNNKQINNLADALDENDAVNLNMLSRFTAELKFKLDDKTEMLQEKCDRLERYLNNLKKHYQRKMLAKMGNYKIVTIKIRGINKIPQKITRSNCLMSYSKESSAIPPIFWYDTQAHTTPASI